MSRLDYCQYYLLNRDCYDWKNDKCDECNIFKAYCEGARMAKASIVRCKDCEYFSNGKCYYPHGRYDIAVYKRVNDDDFFSWAKMKGGAE